MGDSYREELKKKAKGQGKAVPTRADGGLAARTARSKAIKRQQSRKALYIKAQKQRRLM